MNIFKKIFCGHKWVMHHRERNEVQTFKITMDYERPIGPVHQQTTEILICDKCGKIKILEY